MKYRSEDIENLLSHLRIEEVVGDEIELKKSGANYKGLCPFHPDTTPSFSVSPTKNICKCFVCGAGGNAIKFYSMYHKISYEEAVGELAKKYNVPIKAYENKNFRQKEENEKYYKIMEEAHNYYQENIFENQGRIALEYLNKRGVSPKVIRENQLGYALSEWSGLFDHLIKKGFQKDDIVELGLAKNGEKGIYDAFRNRIMFPIYSVSGRIIAFGGRTLESSKEIPKYINSPDTPIFKKGKNLYGIKDKGSILKKKNYSLLMEGYMDVLSAHSYGFDVALASLGTAFTYEQGELLKKYTNNVIMSLDMDSAGQMATERTALILKNLGFNIRVLKLENAKDPDEYLKTFGKEAFLKCVKNSLEIFDFLYELYSKEYDLSNIMSKEKFIARFKEFFKNVESILERSLYLDKLAKYTNLDKNLLKETLIDNNVYKKVEEKIEIFSKKEKEKQAEHSILEEMTIELIFSQIDFFKYFFDKTLESSFSKKIFYFFENLEEGKELSMELMEFIKQEEFTESERDKILTLMFRSTEYSDEKKRQELLKEIYKSWFLKEIKTLEGESKDLLLTFKLKKLEMELGSEISFVELVEKYKKFRGILSENNIL
ncbi:MULTISPECIES: DNA primase [Fusobacterium]|uniref:DNA primase n=1 Tax=Fusobacterium TaxID=848 RepID=UPI001F33D44C|nr:MULTISPECIES: DNA primase [Fusobacterium]MCF2611678.1 DNA primase [Fusobacterium perfoetens]MDY2980403.1 DNA primase [Fusobacterium sp.]